MLSIAQRLYQREYKRQRRSNPEFREKEREYNRVYAKVRRPARTTPEQYKARYTVNNALRSGKLVRPLLCEACQEPRRLHAHHHLGYDHPLDVRWLCQPCHARAH